MVKIELVDAGCFISQMNELLLIDPLYITYAITHYFNCFINDKKDLLPQESLNGIYFPNAKAGLWSSFAIRENNNFSCNSKDTDRKKYDQDKSYNNEMVISLICFNNTEFMHEYMTIQKINELDWQTYEINKNHIGNSLNNKNNNLNNEKDYSDESFHLSNYFTNILTVESGQVGLFCIESIKRSSNILFEKNTNNDINNKEQLDNLFRENLNVLYPWYNKICDLTLSSSIGIIDLIDKPVGCVCISNSDCVVNYLCEIVKDDITDEIWAIRVNFLKPLK
ncbi:conserved Plasmodium protein, unknown function [Plasmodium gallinaceum]|uniref:Uncharacterized protein n=1 Tax=Plasmodium gallinaceum TaxID=5849 RepID=A0A1J1GPN4_PLAGA|nr:conserved Plasmodium protein, unknown function [Plasmodium gallinaceum]CRG94260.1 conserved Plasmodium protein, unknown function [Plasmodium gallinaceum]